MNSTPKKSALPVLILAFLSLLFAPLLFYPGLHLAFAIPQVTFIRSAILILLFFFILFCVRNKIFPDAKSLLRSSPLIFLLLFFFVMLLASLFGKAPSVSFFGGYFRQQGFFSHLHYLIFFLIVIYFFRSASWRMLLFAASSLSGTLLAAHGVLQKFGFDPLFRDWDQAYLLGRIFSTLGHPDFLASLLLFTITASAILVTTPLRTRNLAIKKLLFLFGWLGIVLQAIALVFTLSRAALLGLFVGVLFLLLTFFHKGRAFKTVILGGIAVMGLLIGLQFFASQKNSLPRVLDRLILKEESLRSVETRLQVWRGSLRLFLDSPFLGHGPETFYYTFQKYQSPKLLALESYTSSADKPHNFLIDLLVSTGAFGLLTFLFFIISLFHHFFRLKKKTLQETILASGVLAYFVSDLFGFGLSAHSIYLFVFLALFFTMVTPLKYQPQFQSYTFSRKEGVSLLAVIVLLSGISIYVFNWKSLKADAQFYQGEFEQAFKMNSREPLYGLAFGEKLLAEGKFDAALVTARKVARLTGDDRDTEVLLGKIYAALGKEDRKAYKLSDEAFSRAFQMSPVSPLVLIPWGDSLFNQGRYEDSLAVYEYLLRITPAYWTWTPEELAKKPFFDRERYRIFFKENPGFIDILKNLQEIHEQLRNFTVAKIYRDAVSHLQK